MTASAQRQTEEPQPEQAPTTPEAAPGQAAGTSAGAPRGPGHASKSGAGAAREPDDKARVSGDQARKDKLTDKVARQRFEAQSKEVKPGGFGQNLDKAGLRPLRANEMGPEKDVSKKAVAAPPASWRDRVIGTISSDEVAPDDPGHTYHLLNDETVVSTSEPAVIDSGTAQKAANKVTEKPGPEKAPQVTEIVKQIESMQMTLQSQRTRTTDVTLPTELAEDRRKAKQIRSWLDQCEAAGLNHKEVRQAREDLAGMERNIDALEGEHAEAVKQQEARKKKGDDEAGEGDASEQSKAPASKKDKAKAWAKDHTEMKGSLIKKEVGAGGVLFGDDKAKESEGPLGSKRVSQYSALGASTKAGVDVSIGQDGLQAEVGAEAKATLVDMQERWEWRFPFDVLGEQTEATLYLFAKGMVGAEAKAKITANVKALSPKSPKLDENEIVAGAGAFAGAKLQLGVGAAYEWKKKGPKEYAGKLAKSARAIIRLVSAVNPSLGWLLNQLGGADAATDVLKWLFDWGAQGKVPLLGIEAMAEGSAGVGVQAMAKAGIKGGKLDFMAKANATWGLGLGGMVKVMLDVVEGPKYAVLCLGELLPMAEEYAKEKIEQAVASGVDAIGALWDWLSADDKAREAVANGAHKCLGAKERGHMIKTMMEGYCGDDDENAIISILRFSKGKGDMWATIRHAGGSDAILWALDGSQDSEACKLMGR